MSHRCCPQQTTWKGRKKLKKLLSDRPSESSPRDYVAVSGGGANNQHFDSHRHKPIRFNYMFSAGLAAAVADEYCERAAIHSFAGFRGNKKT